MINEALRLLRVFNDIKAKDMAKLLNISPSYLSEIEKGKKDPSLNLIKKYAKMFNTSPSTILFFSKKISSDGNSSKFKKTIAKKTIDFLLGIENEGKEKIST